MSRFVDNFDYDDEHAVLDQGRWERNARAALKGKRGRKVLADLREALIALPEHRLIDGALCTVGGADKRAPLMTEQEATEAGASAQKSGLAYVPGYDWVSYLREGRADLHRELASAIEQDRGEGCCAIAAYIWHQKVKAGMNPQEAFASLPTVFSGDEDCGDPLGETAELGKQAGLTYTLAWELAYRNDETYQALTPEERWSEFIQWIDEELAEVTP